MQGTIDITVYNNIISIIKRIDVQINKAGWAQKEPDHKKEVFSTLDIIFEMLELQKNLVEEAEYNYVSFGLDALKRYTILVKEKLNSKVAEVGEVLKDKRSLFAKYPGAEKDIDILYEMMFSVNGWEIDRLSRRDESDVLYDQFTKHLDLVCYYIGALLRLNKTIEECQEKFSIAEPADGPNVEPDVTNPTSLKNIKEFTTPRQVMALELILHFYYQIEGVKKHPPATKKAALAEFLTTGKNLQNIKIALTDPYRLKQDNELKIEDLKFIRPYFVDLKMDKIVRMIDDKIEAPTIPKKKY